ncbi:MAG: hypothetical protein QM713_00450 [Arachnia sp.]
MKTKVVEVSAERNLPPGMRRSWLLEMAAWYAAGIPTSVALGVWLSWIVESSRLVTFVGEEVRDAWTASLPLGPWFGAVAILGSIFSLLVALPCAGNCEQWINGRMTRSRTPWVVALASITVGLLIGERWRAPAPPAERLPTDLLTSLLYPAPVWLPVVFALATFVALLVRIRSEVVARRLAARRDRLLREGMCISAPVTRYKVRYAADDIRKELPIGAHGRVEWEGPDGVVRVAERDVSEPQHKNAMAGGFPHRALVLFDPLAPDDENQVFVSFVRDLEHLDLCHWLPAYRAR